MTPCVYTIDGKTFRFAPEFPDGIAARPQAEREAAGWYNLVCDEPETDETHEARPTGYSRVEAGYARTYVIVEREIRPTKYSKLKLYAAIASLPARNDATAWDALKAWLESKTIEGLNGWMAFTLAQEVSNAHPLFEALYAEALTVLGLTREQGDALLAECVLDEDSAAS